MLINQQKQVSSVTFNVTYILMVMMKLKIFYAFFMFQWGGLSCPILTQSATCILIYLYIYLRYLSQETLRNPQIARVGNSQFFCGIVKRCSRNRQRVSA